MQVTDETSEILGRRKPLKSQNQQQEDSVMKLKY